MAANQITPLSSSDASYMGSTICKFRFQTILVTLILFSAILNSNSVFAFYNPNDPEALDDYILNNLQMVEGEPMIDEPLERAVSSLSSGHSPGSSSIPMKRSCIRRSGICDARPHDCCLNSVCRCNLWGANCRCQRMGLFQRLGRK